MAIVESSTRLRIRPGSGSPTQSAVVVPVGPFHDHQFDLGESLERPVPVDDLGLEQARPRSYLARGLFQWVERIELPADLDIVPIGIPCHNVMGVFCAAPRHPQGKPHSAMSSRVARPEVTVSTHEAEAG